MRTLLPLMMVCAIAGCTDGALPSARESAPTIAREVLSLGSGDANPTYFVKVHDMAVADDGTVYVADSGDHNIKVFNPAGGFVRAIGRSGKGPGEFTTVDRIWLSGDTLLALDLNAGYQFTAFNAESKPIVIRKESPATGTTFLVRRSLPGWVGEVRHIALGNGSADVWSRPLNRMEVINPFTGTTIRKLYDIRHPDTLARRGPFRGVYQPGAVGNKYVFMGVQGNPYEVHVFDIESGDLIRKFSHAYKARKVDEKWVEEALQLLHSEFAKHPDWAGEGEEPAVTARLQSLDLGDEIGAIGSMVVGTDETVWIERLDKITNPAGYILTYMGFVWGPGAGVTTWDVFTADGKQLAQVKFPQGFRLFYATGLTAYGVSTDDTGVQTVSKFEAQPIQK